MIRMKIRNPQPHIRLWVLYISIELFGAFSISNTYCAGAGVGFAGAVATTTPVVSVR